MKENVSMIHPPAIKESVRALRQRGLSISEIAKRYSLPKTTVHLWIRDIRLSKDQSEILKVKAIKALAKARIKAQHIKKAQRAHTIALLTRKGIEDIGILTKRDLLILGVSLYWAEGFKNKHEKRLGFCNSDPAMIRLYMKFLTDVMCIEKSDLTARVGLNESYKNSALEIQEFWEKETGLLRAQFTKPFFQKTVWKKEFIDRNYRGVLRIHAKKSANLLLYMRGLMQGLSS